MVVVNIMFVQLRTVKAKDSLCYESHIRPILRIHKADPTKLLRVFPDFQPNAIVHPHFKWTHLHYACFVKHLHVVAGLVECGAKLKQKDKYGNTPLAIACNATSRGKVRTNAWPILGIKLPVWIIMQPDGQATINDANSMGNTILHIALEQNRIWFICFLLLHGADPTLRNKVGHTPAEQPTHIHALSHQTSSAYRILKTAAAYHTLGVWRPSQHHDYPHKARRAIRTLLILWHVKNRGTRPFVITHPQCALFLLPVEVLDYMFAHVVHAIRWYEPIKQFEHRQSLAAFARQSANASTKFVPLPSTNVA